MEHFSNADDEFVAHSVIQFIYFPFSFLCDRRDVRKIRKFTSFCREMKFPKSFGARPETRTVFQLSIILWRKCHSGYGYACINNIDCAMWKRWRLFDFKHAISSNTDNNFIYMNRNGKFVFENIFISKMDTNIKYSNDGTMAWLFAK